jgi:hypothetical protein
MQVMLAHALWKSGAKPPAGSPKLFDFTFKLALEKMMIQFKLEQAHEHSNYRYVQARQRRPPPAPTFVARASCCAPCALSHTRGACRLILHGAS